MDQLEAYIFLWALSLLVGLVFNRSFLPVPLMLVVTGLLLGFIPGMPAVEIQPKLILDVFLPLLVYAACANFSWRDVRHNLRPIIWLSIGHVFFIASLVAMAIHTVLPTLGWPLSFVLGAVVAPPDDVAILAIADKINFPSRVLTIIKGESLLNDATALILFRFSLAAVITHRFSAFHAVSAFILVVLGETAYGILIGTLMGRLRMRIQDPMLQMMASVLTPFLAYIPPERLGGCGILAVAISGFVIGHRYLERFPPEVRIINISVWNSLSFALQSLIFLMVGLNFEHTLHGISSIPLLLLIKYSLVVILTVILGRLVWVFSTAYLHVFLMTALRKKVFRPPWQQTFLVSWAGMRGVISLAAVLAIPLLPIEVQGANPKDLFIFLTFTVIAATLLLQGLSLPWMVRKLGLQGFGLRERFSEHLSELAARVKIASTVLDWLLEYGKKIKDQKFLQEKVKLRIREYQLRVRQLTTVLDDHHHMEEHEDNEEQKESSSLSMKINEIERSALLKLWHEKEISFAIRTKILQQLDHRFKHITG